MNAWIVAHTLALLAGWYVFSALVSGMPAPGSTSGAAYQWLYHSLHVLAGDLSDFLKTGIRTKGPGAGS